MNADNPAVPMSVTPAHSVDPGYIAEALPDPVVVLDASARLLWANRAAADSLGWTLDELAGHQVDALVHPDDLATALLSLESVRHKKVGTLIEARILTKSGSYRSFEVRGAPAVSPDGTEAVIMAMRDTTDRGLWEVSRGHSAINGRVLDHSAAVTMLLERDGTIRSATRALTRLLGHDLEAILGTSLLSLVAEPDRASAATELSDLVANYLTRTFETRLITTTGEEVAFRFTGVNLLDDLAVGGLVITATDIRDLVAARARLEHLAAHDPLTGLPNRVLLRERLDQALALAQRRGGQVAIVFCDLDQFKAVNDTYGHLVGDAVLVQVAERLRGAARASDTVGRLSGDEFVVIIETEGDAEVADIVARMTEAMRAPFVAAPPATVHLAVSCGVTIGDGHSSSEALLARADFAMYEAKRRSG
jgi:diguanylate cyclase (GGDEF)-like protein/PAS domain S-box-containing protein